MALLSPIGLLAGGVAVLTTNWALTTESGQRAAEGLGKAFENLAETFSTTWSGIKDAVKAGKLELAFQIAGVGIKAVWLEMLIAMGKAFAAWVSDHRERIIALATLWGAITGTKIGGRFGIVGAGIGAAVGGAGAGFGADALLDVLQGFGSNPGLEAKLGAAKGDLARLRGEAAKAAADAANKPFADPYRQRAFEAVKGAFNVASAAQQFGYGDKAQTNELLKQILVASQETATKVGAEIAKRLVLR